MSSWSRSTLASTARPTGHARSACSSTRSSSSTASVWQADKHFELRSYDASPSAHSGEGGTHVREGQPPTLDLGAPYRLMRLSLGPAVNAPHVSPERFDDPDFAWYELEITFASAAAQD